MKVPALVISVTVVMFGVLWGGVVWHPWQRLREQTVSVRLTSAGNVIWGEAHIDVNMIQPELQRSADLLRANGFEPRLLIEHRRDAQDTDIAKLARIAHDVGFAIVDTQAHNCASPSAVELPD